MMANKNLKEYMLKEIDIIQNIINRIAFIPLVVFWFLDSYFLQQERLYRKLYEWVIKNRLKTEENLFNMNTDRFKTDVQSRIRIMFSITLGWFYSSIAVLIIVYAIILLLVRKGGGF
jgi:hypothetical protein